MLVMHLEDDKALAEIMRETFLLIVPYMKLHQFLDSDSAVDFVRANASAIDLCIMDIRVPGSMDGLGVAKETRKAGCTAPIIITSAYVNPSFALLNELQAQWYPKPWHVTDLERTLLKIAEGKK